MKGAAAAAAAAAPAAAAAGPPANADGDGDPPAVVPTVHSDDDAPAGAAGSAPRMPGTSVANGS